MIRSVIEFENGKVKGVVAKAKIAVVTNIDEYGLDIEDAFDNYIARTNKITTKGFCKYVVSKDPVKFMCVPESEVGHYELK
jgi:UDP-N-acetylmuramoylalanine-D-glutamate ligase